jgi:hypothetical protein
MPSFLALLTFLLAAGVHVERVSLPGPNGVNLDAAQVLPEGAAKMPPVVALHGCGGPFPSRDGQWAIVLARAGHIVLMPDSFGSRGLGSQCARKEREVTPSGLRRQNAIDAALWLVARPGTPSGGAALIGWSNGGSIVLSTARVAWRMPVPMSPRGRTRRPASPNGWRRRSDLCTAGKEAQASPPRRINGSPPVRCAIPARFDSGTDPAGKAIYHDAGLGGAAWRRRA